VTNDRAIVSVLARMQDRLDILPAGLEHHRVFLATYQRTTRAIGDAIDSAEFDDADWVDAWDADFADLYLAALDAEIAGDRRPSRPWRLAFAAPATLPPLRHVLFGINAHINYDLPQALLAVISDADFNDPALIERRRADHERIDGVLGSRVSAEDHQLADRRTLLDRALTPLNRYGSRRFLREARQKVWHNTLELNTSRRLGPEKYATRLAELELLSAAKVAELLAPGQVLLRLAIAGFGVTLPPAA